MPFVPELRERLTTLKEELDSGLLPSSLYEELCRSSILEFGNFAYETDALRKTSEDFSFIHALV